MAVSAGGRYADLGVGSLAFHGNRSSICRHALSELGCDKLNVLNFQKMNQTQADYAGQCAAREAAWAWERQYGGLDEHGMIGAVVYEP